LKDDKLLLFAITIVHFFGQKQTIIKTNSNGNEYYTY